MEGSPTWGTPVKVASSPDKAGAQQHCQMLWVRQTNEEGVTKVNPWSNASQERSTSSNLTDMGWVAARNHGLAVVNSFAGQDVAGREAAAKVCGVTAAKLQGHSGAPNLVSGRK